MKSTLKVVKCGMCGARWSEPVPEGCKFCGCGVMIVLEADRGPRSVWDETPPTEAEQAMIDYCKNDIELTNRLQMAFDEIDLNRKPGLGVWMFRGLIMALVLGGLYYMHFVRGWI